MPAVNETGHYKNVTSLEKMIQKAISFGTAYNPSKALIKLDSLQPLFTQAKADYLAVSPANVPYNNAVNDRMSVFANYKTYSTQIVAAFKTSSDASAEKIKDLIAINRKIQGTRTPKSEETPLDPNAPAPETISASQQSYDMKFDHFSKLADLITGESSYAPNEAELKLTAILAYKALLGAANSAVVNTYEVVNNARIKRDKTLYKPGTGVYYVQDMVKEYVKGVFKANSIQYKQMAAIKFTKPRKLFI